MTPMLEHSTGGAGATSARGKPAARRIVAAIVAFALLRGVAWAYMIPPLQAPDEPSHMLFVAQLRANGALPIAFIVRQDRLGRGSTTRPPAMRAYLADHGYTTFLSQPYESTQAPLYYVLCALATWPLPNDPETLLYGCRLVSALLGALAVFAAARAAATLAPDRRAFVVGVPLALALWPQFGFQAATVSNDIALDLAGAVLAWAWAAAAQSRSGRWPLIIGALTGLGVLTKLTAVTTLPGSALVLLGRARAGRVALPRLLRDGVVAGSVALLLAGPWLVRNQLVYGEPTGSAQVFSVYHTIYTSRLHLPETTRIIVPPLDQFSWYSFSSFWAVFGWRGVYLPTPFGGHNAPFLEQAVPFYLLAAALTALGVGGSLAWAVRRLRARAPLPPSLGWPLAAYAVTAVAAVASLMLYNLTTDGQPQGRYTFVALVPFCVIGVGGALHATRSPRLNNILAAAGLAILVVLQLASWWALS
ncbi:MAG: glycosyltransferase family 39 protein [Chloroflexia bacterium]